jgi:opacity protein-like surface antigen
VSTGFAPQIFQNEHVKYLDYMAGMRFGPHRDTLSPWAHVLVGGAHLQPQTAGNSKTSFGMKAGIGADYRLTSVASVRVELDWLRTQFFNGAQNNFQAATGLVFHF